MNVPLALAATLGGLASWWDLRTGQIPNWLALLAGTTGLAWAGWEAGWKGLGDAVIGAAVGFFALVGLYLLGGLGGGDVKLMAGLGSLAGKGHIGEALFWMALTGGVWAAAALLWGRFKGHRPAPRTIPYAPAIALGTVMSLWN